MHDRIATQAQETNEIEQLLYDHHAIQNKLNYRQVAIIKHALKHSNIQYKIAAHQQSHNVTYNTARNDLLSLAKLGLLLQKSGKAFIFMAPKDLKKKLHKIK